jgi:hypothetical protein
VKVHVWMPGARTRDASEGAKGMMERKAAMVAEAKSGEDRMSKLLDRVKAAQKTIKKRGETPHNGYAAQSEHLVKQARAKFSLVINQLNDGALYKFDQLMAGTKDPERTANEAVQSIEKQASQ